MNYYDEEIPIGRPDTKNLEKIHTESLTGAGGKVGVASSGRASAARRTKPSELKHLDDDDDDEEDSDVQQTQLQRQRRPGSHLLPSAKALDDDTDPSETDSDDSKRGAGGGRRGASANSNDNNSDELRLTPSHWEKLSVQQEVKDLFLYILKYTPQHIETEYHLQPFIPEYVPAVGDVDAFLKVSLPQAVQSNRQQELNEHLQKMGVYLLDEPSGQQSEPSLLNMKLRSVLSGSGANSRSAAAAQEIPVANSAKDIDKWITEVEQICMAQAAYDVQPLIDMEALIMDWPLSYAAATNDIEMAYQRCLQSDISLTDYIRLLCEKFEISNTEMRKDATTSLEREEQTLTTQIDYILSVQTLFCLYLAANQSWERESMG